MTVNVPPKRIEALDLSIELTFNVGYKLNMGELKFVLATMQNKDLKNFGDYPELSTQPLQNWSDILKKKAVKSELFDKDSFVEAY